ncbi:hypothetical protein LCGC14_1902700 [marine sediment metagenome]|uniref:Uncharacterized protein n=1 Tax=marine sediment metagenome TaxID=412755 RepID=A0A0F9IU45_9ZZZZ
MKNRDYAHIKQSLLLEMHGNIKVVMSELKIMNGQVKEIKREQIDHERDAVGYRRKIDKLWTIMHTVCWIIFILTGSGILWRFYG